MAVGNTSRSLLRRVLSFQELLFLIPHLLTILTSSINSFLRSYSPFMDSFTRLSTLSTRCTYTSIGDQHPNDDDNEDAEYVDHQVSSDGEEEETMSRQEVEGILERLGLGVNERLEVCMGHEEVFRIFEADEPSFEDARRAFAVFDEDGDGVIGALDLRRVLAGLGFEEDVAACRLMIVKPTCGSKDGRMNLFQFVMFLENGFW